MENWPSTSIDRLRLIIEIARNPPVGSQWKSIIDQIATNICQQYKCKNIQSEHVYKYIRNIEGLTRLMNKHEPKSSSPSVHLSTFQSKDQAVNRREEVVVNVHEKDMKGEEEQISPSFRDNKKDNKDNKTNIITEKREEKDYSTGKHGQEEEDEDYYIHSGEETPKLKSYNYHLKRQATAPITASTSELASSVHQPRQQKRPLVQEDEPKEQLIMDNSNSNNAATNNDNNASSSKRRTSMRRAVLEAKKKKT